MKWGRKWSHPGLIFSHNWGHIQPRQTNRFQEKADLIISILLLQCKYEYRKTSIANIPHSVWLFKVSSGLSSGPKNVTSVCFSGFWKAEPSLRFLYHLAPLSVSDTTLSAVRQPLTAAVCHSPLSQETLSAVFVCGCRLEQKTFCSFVLHIWFKDDDDLCCKPTAM